MANPSDILAAIEANLKQAIQRKRPQEQARVLKKFYFNLFFCSYENHILILDIKIRT